jgi:hypothetical protein
VPLVFDLDQLGGQQLALPGVVEGASRVRGDDGAEFGEGEPDRLGHLDALDDLDRAGVVVGVQPRPGPARGARHQPEVGIQADGVPADPGLTGDLAYLHAPAP